MKTSSSRKKTTAKADMVNCDPRSSCLFVCLLTREMINVIGEQMFEEVREKVARGKYDDDQR